VTLVGAPEPPSMLPSNSLSADSVARLVSAATVEATLVVEPLVELALLLVLVLAGPLAAATPLPAPEAALYAPRTLYRPEAWLLPTLPMDMMPPIGTAGARAIGRSWKNLKKVFRRLFSRERRCAGCSVLPRQPWNWSRRSARGLSVEAETNPINQSLTSV